jgi:hypothetical protein
MHHVVTFDIPVSGQQTGVPGTGTNGGQSTVDVRSPVASKTRIGWSGVCHCTRYSCPCHYPPKEYNLDAGMRCPDLFRHAGGIQRTVFGYHDVVLGTLGVYSCNVAAEVDVAARTRHVPSCVLNDEPDIGVLHVVRATAADSVLRVRERERQKDVHIARNQIAGIHRGRGGREDQGSPVAP